MKLYVASIQGDEVMLILHTGDKWGDRLNADGTEAHSFIFTAPRHDFENELPRILEKQKADIAKLLATM